jgi:Tfp pilus assembly protein PilP
MNLIKLPLIFLTLFLLNTIASADNHDKEKLVNEVQKITEELDSLNEELPLNDPFAGQSSNNNNVNSSVSIPEDQLLDEMSLYNFKLVGLIAGEKNSYISMIKSNGEPYSLTIGQYLGKIKLVDLRLNEAIFENEDKNFIIIDFNNQIREADEY